MSQKIRHPFLICILLVLTAGLQAQTETSVTTEDLNIFSWRHIGPWTFSGRITDFAVPRGQSKVYYVATATGGLWQTEDGGLHFKPIFDKYGNMSMGHIAVAPSDPEILYLGTGEAHHARSTAHGNGLWKSTDAGKSWTRAGLERSFFIPRIRIHPENPDIVYVAAEGHLYDNDSDSERGLFKTSDGGKTWTQILDLKDRGVGDFVVDPTNFDVIIAFGYKTYRRAWTFIDKQEGNALYKSSDGGATWKKLTNGLPSDLPIGRSGLAIYPKDPRVVYVRLDERVNLGFDERENRYSFRSGRVFNDDFFFNRFASYKIPQVFTKMVTFQALDAEDEENLAEKLNKLIEDKEFITRTGVDFPAFNAAARRYYAKNKDMLAAIEEIENTLERDAEEKRARLEINAFVLDVLFNKDKPGTLNEGFADAVQFDPEGFADAEALWNAREKAAADPGMLDRFTLKISGFKNAAKKQFAGDEAKLKELDSLTDSLAEMSRSRFRYQTLNRYILQVLYGEVLSTMSPVEMDGVIYRSSDQGETWTRMTEYRIGGGSAEVNSSEAGYYGRIEVDPNDEQVLFVTDPVVKRSNDGGKTFRNVAWTGDHKGHVDTRVIWIDPRDSDHILNGNDGGVSETWDGGRHWHQKDTIAAQQFYDIFADDQMPYNVMGGTQDNGCWMGPTRNRNAYGVYPADWTYLPSGDGFYVVRDWWNPEYIYFESQFGSSRRMNLETGETISLSYRNTREERAAGRPPQRYQWDAPIVLSPHNPGIVFICSQHVYRSLSRGDVGTWQRISPDLTRADPRRIAESKLTNMQYPTIYTFAESPVRPGLYWAGTDDGNLHVSSDGGNSWTNLTFRYWDKTGRALKKRPSGAVLPFDRWVTRVEPSNHDKDTCYVTFSGYRTHTEDTSYIFVTRDLGQTWQDIGAGMRNPVNDIEEDPDNPDVLYLATDYGLFVSLDGGGGWTEMSDETPDVIIMDMDIQKRERDLAIASYGRGFYIADIWPFREFKKDIFQKTAHLFEPQRVVKWALIERRGQSYGAFARTPNPPVEASIYYWLKEDTKNVRILFKDLEGNVLHEAGGQGKKGLHKVTWNLRKKADTSRGRRYGRSGPMVEAGTFKVCLMIGEDPAATQSLKIVDDPILIRR
jgi:photosystem II stability/assembly factor-like uncharacterized protein